MIDPEIKKLWHDADPKKREAYRICKGWRVQKDLDAGRITDAEELEWLRFIGLSPKR